MFTCTGSFPPKTNDLSAGIDLYQQESVHIQPFETIIIDTQTRINVPANYMGSLYLRSSASKNGLSSNVGIIDSSYAGPIKLCIKNLNNFSVELIKGESYSQLIIQPILTPSLENQEFTFKTTRNTSGFGSTGHCNIKLQLEQDPLRIFDIPTGLIKINNIACFYDTPINTATNETMLLQQEMQYTMCIDNLYEETQQLTDSANNFISMYMNDITTTDKTDLLTKYLSLQSEKLATLNTDIMIDNNISRENFKKLQHSDEIYICVFNALNSDKKYGKYKIISDLLYKELQTTKGIKILLCLPTLILPNIVHSLHKQLNHPSTNQMKKHFQSFFFHPFASTILKGLNTTCLTCRLSTTLKPNLFKVKN